MCYIYSYSPGIIKGEKKKQEVFKMFELIPFANSRGMDLYRPFRDLENLERSLFSGSAMGSFQTDIKDSGDAYVLEADLPGVKKEDIHIDIDGDRLSISAQRSSGSDEKDSSGNYIRCERSYGSFTRSFDISGVRSEDISAAFDNGVLTLTMPKQVQTVPASRRLEIR